MSTDFGRAYEVLGVKPGVSERELKAAHRDLAKVWHPDRFLHDPRLQEKAQEKLKEINEAYDRLVSGKVPPKPAPKPPPVVVQESNPIPVRRSRGFGSAGIAFLIFMAVFAVTIGFLLRKPPSNTEIVTEPTEQVSIPPPARNRAKQNPETNTDEVAAPTPEGPTVEPLATVTVVIDPNTGLLATPDCPFRSRMTYPTGSQPNGYCNAQHPPKTSASASQSESEKESLIKSIGKKVGF
ncbi:MAG TPA: J domain-containing protein [Pyrinomonadaceae bacterium]|nr:J domain-containing protein [Pyrinomonadaceae bacterium]